MISGLYERLKNKITCSYKNNLIQSAFNLLYDHPIALLVSASYLTS